jgi:UDP-N-acetyl-D-mannosaminuronic acid dehydrogenase
MTDPTLCVHGLGYVGLPTAAMLADSGFRTLGYDTDPDHRQAIVSGELQYDESGLGELVERVIATGDLTVVDEVEAADYHFVCVPTPFVEESGQTDLRYVKAAAEAIAPVLQSGDGVVLASTVPPGTTQRVLAPILEESGLTAGEDFTLAFSPETVLPGNILAELRENERLVGNVGEDFPADIIAVYESFVDADIHTTDATTAEFVKLIQNAYRDTNIAFANETAKLAHEHGIDSREAIALANDHPRVDILSPGPGVGGHCLPIDPLFLNHNGNGRTNLIETAREINDSMATFVTELLVDELGSLEGRRIAVLGVAYKGGVDDTRHSPGLTLVEHLTETAADTTVVATDPRVEDAMIPLVPLESAMEDADAFVLVTDHPEYRDLDPETVGESMAQRVLVDTRAMLESDRWRDAGFTVRRV